jgi:hypothetical protein
MVMGLDKFRQYFAGLEDQYAIIGGTACDLLFKEAGLAFRATKDIDLVLCVEVVDARFAEKFKSFIDAAGYEVRERNDGKKEYHRFYKPKDQTFPYMVELFSRKSGVFNLPDDAQVQRVSVEDDAISLSAILLDEDYFAAVKSARVEVEGVMIADETVLIPFKAKAFLDLTERKAKGEKVDQKNIDKHKRDVFRLVQLLPKDARVDFAPSIMDDLHRFIGAVEADDTLDPNKFGVALTRPKAIEILRAVYERKS